MSVAEPTNRARGGERSEKTEEASNTDRVTMVGERCEMGPCGLL